MSFDGVSLFTNIPTQDATNIIRNKTNDETTNSVSILLNSTYLIFQGTIYDQSHGIAMESPL